ncbi:elongator complex protein 1 [Trichomonascus vanleenenianus]|uniref:Elongator subunit IKI3 n=1 Tax=Trichomonascus vanleenenianus TaxID=2268995 RepID=UPI003EC9A9B5
MRNLITSHRGRLDVSSLITPDQPVAKVVSFDPIGDSMLCAFGPSEFNPTIEIQQIYRSGKMHVLAYFDAPDPSAEIKSLYYSGDSNSAVIVLSSGDIVNVVGGEDENSAVVEIVGSLDDTIDDAQWSPDEEVLAIATTKTLVLLSRSFDLISESSTSIEDLKLSKHVSVGWGKKETQFQGKGAKALRDPTVPVKVDDGHVVQGDDKRRKLSWRGDGEYVALSGVDSLASGIDRRTIRVYSRTGVLDSVSEPCDTLEHHVAWRPSGNVIASVQRQSGNEESEGPDLVFFERNGLRRYEFSIRVAPEAEVVDIAWNSDSDILAIQLKDRIQLWTTKNYHWYLKQEVVAKDGVSAPLWMKWHPEKNTSLFIAFEDAAHTVHFETHTFLWTVISGSMIEPNDLGTTVVLDGEEIKVTPLKLSNAPPPMSFRDIEACGTPIHVAVSRSSNRFALLYANHVDIAEWDLSLHPRVRAPSVVESIKFQDVLGMSLDAVPRQVTFIGDDLVAVAADETLSVAATQLLVVNIKSKALVTTHSVSPDIFVLKTDVTKTECIYETIDGSVYRLNSAKEYETELLHKLPQRCDTIDLAPNGVVFGLAQNGKLYANSRQLAASVTSLMVTDSHAVFTTAQHYLKFSHLQVDVEAMEIPADDLVNDERCRAIERGSLLVTIIPSKTALILQAPRGNLETIHPRILVLSKVRKDIDNLRYDEAFAACRVHRIDMNLLHDYSPQQFFDQTELFIKQLNKIESLDLFLSGLRNEDVSESMYRQTLKEADEGNVLQAAEAIHLKANLDVSTKVNRVCDAILKVLLTPEYKSAYLQSVLTAYACKTPPDLEAALELVGKDRKAAPEQAEFSVQHLCFLQDVELLYRTALGIYDLDLALLVAQQSQKDPKEYLPFLRDLQEQTMLRRKFKIDTHLERYSKAIKHLAEMGEFDELCVYTEEHELYQDALRIYQHNVERHNVILALYASYLLGKTKYFEAGLAYENLKMDQDALDAYELAGAWQESLPIVQRASYSEEKRADIMRHLADMAVESRNYRDAATIYLDYIKDVPEALRVLCKGFFFSDAIRQAVLHNQPGLLETVVDPGLTEGFAQTIELISDCKAQVKSQINRLRELREKKAADPLGFFGGPDGADNDAPDNVSLAPTESSTAPSFFTRYTGKTGTTAKTGASRKTAKNRRREERKRARGKKGSVYEEEYLVNSMGRLIERLDQTESDAVRLIEGLMRRGMRDHAYQIQSSFVDVRNDIKAVVVEVFTLSERDRERYDDDGNKYYLPPRPIPEIREFPGKDFLNF